MRVQCPDCGKTFSCSGQKEGKRVTCPRCDERFVAEDTETDVDEPAAPPGPRRSRRQRDDEDSESPRRKSEPKKEGTSTLKTVLGLVLTAVLFVVALFCYGLSEYFARRAGRRLADNVNNAEMRIDRNKADANPQRVDKKRPGVEFGGGNGATKIVGGGRDPEFSDEAPAGGLLIGLELGIVNNNSIKAIRPIYLVNGEEVKGPQHGTNLANVVTVKAKPGYAVSSLTVNAGLWMDGMSMTFMRNVDGKLDPGDSYQSDYLGGTGGNRSILGGDANPIIGIIGKSNQRDCTGIGLLVKK